MNKSFFTKARRRTVAVALIVAAISAFLYYTGTFSSADLAVQDSFYQHPKITGDTIAIIGIDQQSLEYFGPYPWSRDIVAGAVELLNESEEVRPAVIGLDVLYEGTGGDPEADAHLAKACCEYGNVVTAAAAEFGSEMVIEDDGTFYNDDFSILGLDEPFPELKAGTTEGHINAMLDYDGILRHSLWELRFRDGSTIPSFPHVIADLYRKYNGEDPVGTPEMDSHGFWYIPFSGMPGSYGGTYSISQLYTGEIKASDFAGKIVLIGPYAAGLQDSYPTSIDHAEDMYGIEVNANAIQALLDGNFKSEVPKLPQVILLFVLTFSAIMLISKRSIKQSALICFGPAVLYMIAARILYNNGYILDLLFIPAVLSFVFFISVGINYIIAVIEKHHVRQTFARYVAPEIVNEVLKDDERVRQQGGRVVDIAVLFVDIRGFTTMSEALTASEVVEIINKYLTLTANCILKYNGTLDKFIGDCTMAFWNAPEPQEDYVMNALKAAVAMREGSAALSEELLRTYGRTVAFGIGVHCGEAVVGNIGSPDRMDYTAIGDTVNTSSRLESNAPANTIYISREVVNRLGDRIRCTSLGGSIKLKGKAEGFEVLTLDEIVEDYEK